MVRPVLKSEVEIAIELDAPKLLFAALLKKISANGAFVLWEGASFL